MPALALDRHPIRARPPPVAPSFDFARQLDRAAKQQQFLGQCRLAGIRMRDNRKRPPAQNLVGQGTHQSASAVAEVRAGAGYDGGPAFCQPAAEREVQPRAVDN